MSNSIGRRIQEHNDRLAMKCSIAFLAIAFFGVSVQSFDGIRSDSELGQKLLLQARNLNQNTADISWIAGYSVKFQGCHHVQQWNTDANSADDVRLKTKRLVRFRLCPTSSCTSSNAGGCNGGYGDYIIDMNTFLNAYYEAKLNAEALACQSHTCNCESATNPDYCDYDCYLAASMPYCSEKNPYTNESIVPVNIGNYLSCSQYNNDSYYIGPYCSNQGGSLFMGMFTDDTCSEFADASSGLTTFKTMSGRALPYGDASLVGPNCHSCAATDNDSSGYSVGSQCSTIYNIAGKCESSLATGTTSNPNTRGCLYIEGIKIIRKDGIITNVTIGSSPVATSFIVFFAMASVACGFYIWYLRKRIARKNNQLILK